MIKKAPLRFHPYLKSVIWGGEKICSYKSIPQAEPNIGESWEISAIPGHESVVAEGDYAGRNLPELIAGFGHELLGEGVSRLYNGSFPLLVKFIDANDNLSVQVHPDDTLARRRHGCFGKSEMWYIIRTDEGAKIYSGLKRSITPDEYVRLVADDEFQTVIAVHDSAPGDVFYLPAGRVHAIGAGNMLVEIQQSSDITYRIYDYGRRDAAGNTRELHTELAKDAIDYGVYDDYKAPRAADDESDCEIVRCSHFVTRRLRLHGDASLRLKEDSFSILVCVEGKAEVSCPEGSCRMGAGQTVLIPAAAGRVTLSGDALMLLSRCNP